MFHASEVDVHGDAADAASANANAIDTLCRSAIDPHYARNEKA